MSRTSSTPDLVAFFEGTGTDDQGRSLSEILAWSDRELEWSHDYIQIVFPLPERSDFQHTVAVIDACVFDEFHTRKELRDSLRTAFKRILAFYGFELQENESGNPIVSILALPKRARLFDIFISNIHRSRKHPISTQIQRSGTGGWTITIFALHESSALFEY
jgi:hypothetical protein